MNNFIQRILTGAIFIGLILGSIWWGPLIFQLLFLLVTILALDEFYRLVHTESDAPNRLAGIVSGSIIYLFISFIASGDLLPVYYVLTICFGGLLFFFELFRKREFPFRNISLTLTGIFYTALPLALLSGIAFHQMHYDRAVLIGYFVLLWSSDSFAYVYGNLFGRTKLFPRISPKKTWEGSILGTLHTLGVAWLFYIFNPEVPLWHWMVMAAIICVCGPLGDLTESMLKRSLGVKDSGKLLPGHGGVLDRFDALFLSVPFVWAFLKLAA